MILFPNAKINLGLRVIKKRPDGFHDIETIFLPLKLCDILEFVDDGKKNTNLTVTGIGLDTGTDDNLVVRAWNIMNRKFNIPAVSIHLHKVIPVGAGLGGGSSDAAFMLKGLNERFNCGCAAAELRLLAAELGSDCPFFIDNLPAFATGRGEILESVRIYLDNYEILLIKPDIHVATREAYSGIVPAVPDTSLKTLILNPVPEWQQTIINDFEPVVFHNYPEIRSIKDKLLGSGAVYASMTGSGSAVFGIFATGKIPGELKESGTYFTFHGKMIPQKP